LTRDAWGLGFDLTGANRSGVYPILYGHRARSTLVLNATYAF
jgi:hypothetical protein